MIKNYLEPYFNESDRKKLNDITSKIKELQDENQSIVLSRLQLIEQYTTLKSSPLEILETDQERQNRLTDIDKKEKGLKEQLKEIEKQIFTLSYEIESLEIKTFSKYAKQNDDETILKDALDIIQAVEPRDLIIPENENFKGSVWFSYNVAYNVTLYFVDYFSKSKNNAARSKLLLAVYDRTLEFYPDGFSDQDKKSSFCVFDKAFFKALKERKDKKDRLNYEFEVLSSYKPEKIGHIIPSSVKISSSVLALGTIGSSRQMTIDELLESNKANDLVTFKGLDDNGLQFVFNEKAANKDTILVSFKNLETASGGGTAPSKVFIMALEKMNELGYFNHRVGDQAVTISVRDLTENGAFSSRDKAKTALENAKKTLSNLQVSFTNKNTGLDIDIPWFSPIGWKDKSTLLLMPNKSIDWLKVGLHLAIYPPYIYKLKAHAYKLAYYIFTQARINKAPDKKGNLVFKLKLTTISRELGLPTVDQVTNFRFKQLILDKVIAAMKELTDTDREYYGESRLNLEIESENGLTPREVIETSNLVVTIKKSELTEIYQKIRERKVDLIESAKRKKAANKRKSKEN